MTLQPSTNKNIVKICVENYKFISRIISGEEGELGRLNANGLKFEDVTTCVLDPGIVMIIMRIFTTDGIT